MTERPGGQPEKVWFGHDKESKELVTSMLRTILDQFDTVDASNEDKVSFANLDGKALTVEVHTVTLGKDKPRTRWNRLTHTYPTTEKQSHVYIVSFPSDAMTPPRQLSLHGDMIYGEKRVPVQGSDYQRMEVLKGDELDRTILEAHALISDAFTVTKGNDAQLASEQLCPSDKIRGDEAHDFHTLIEPLLTDVLEDDPRNIKDRNAAYVLNVVHHDQAPPNLAINQVIILHNADNYGLGSDGTTQVITSITFDMNPFGEGDHFSAHLHAKYNPNNTLKEADISYLQTHPQEFGPLANTMKLPLAPAERMRVTEAVQRQIMPANLKLARPRGEEE